MKKPLLILMVISNVCIYPMKESDPIYSYREPLNPTSENKNPKTLFAKLDKELVNKWRDHRIVKVMNYNKDRKKRAIFKLLREWKKMHEKIVSKYYDIRQKGDDLKELRDNHIAIIEIILGINPEYEIEDLADIDISQKSDINLENLADTLMEIYK